MSERPKGCALCQRHPVVMLGYVIPANDRSFEQVMRLRTTSIMLHCGDYLHPTIAKDVTPYDDLVR